MRRRVKNVKIDYFKFQFGPVNNNKNKSFQKQFQYELVTQVQVSLIKYLDAIGSDLKRKYKSCYQITWIVVTNS